MTSSSTTRPTSCCGKWAPRQFSSMAGFAQTIPWRRFMWSGWMNLQLLLVDARVPGDAAHASRQAPKRRATGGLRSSSTGARPRTRASPWPSPAWDWPPFDILGDTLRGTRNILADMRRRPGKLHDALEVATKIFIEYGSGAAGAPICRSPGSGSTSRRASSCPMRSSRSSTGPTCARA